MKDGVRFSYFEVALFSKFCNVCVIIIIVSTVILVQFKYVSSSWTDWEPWSDCTVSCGEGGFTTRSRYCSGEPMSCLGPNFEGEVCEMPSCPVDGVWLEWSDWTNCTEPCGGGEYYRQRVCQDPLYGGTPCEGDYNQTETCNIDPCAVDGNWTEWSNWHTCSVNCGGGMQNQNRTCVGPFYGGVPCDGENNQERECNMHLCPIDGEWVEWSQWSECSSTCNIGQEKRFRSCNNPPPEHGGRDCPGRNKQPRYCYPNVCPVHGGWSLWAEWTQCSKSCDWGLRQRFRSCDNPKPEFGGSYCVGSSTAGESCLIEQCPVHAEWGPWRDGSNCSEPCGSGGRIYRFRVCDSPPPLYGGFDCEGLTGHMVDCYVDRCEVDGSWSEWSEWDQCSRMCETGEQSRSRTCDNPAPTPPDGEYCIGHINETRTCNTHICPVHGGWEPWSRWTICPITCGGDIETRFRFCTNPPPLFRGDDCDGASNEERDCNTDGCPVDGAWTGWSSWTTCSVSCGGGTTSRDRTCTNPAPAWGGALCPKDNFLEWIVCNENPCPIPGGWSQWSNWMACPVTCGGFELIRNRTCDEPEPQYGGDDCPGQPAESTVCNDNPCPVNGSWTAWSVWDECSVPCEGGVQFRTRTCSEPSPAYGGFRCPGVDSGDDPQTWVTNQTCNEQMCPIHGGWIQWSDWPDCPVTCGGATILRYRNCTNPVPQYGGKYCNGKNVSEIICNGDVQCPIHGSWGRWVDWAQCSQSCKGGIRTRLRLCNDPSPLYGGRQCNGSVLEEEICNDIQCPINGGYSKWTQWTECSKTCGGGQTQRTRDCNNPMPEFGGNPCFGIPQEKRLCAAIYCPVHGGYSEWGPWSDCPVTCGGTSVYRDRLCNNPSPKHDGMPCEGPATDTTLCQTNPCPVDGGWSRWTSWSPCSVTCGDGIQESLRDCVDPEPQYGGDFCLGEGEHVVYCSGKLDVCPAQSYAPDNITITVVKKNKQPTIYINWEPPVDLPDYYIVEVKRLYTPGTPSSNASFYKWRTFDVIMGRHTSVAVREQGGMGRFQGDFAVRVSGGSGESRDMSQEYTFNVVKYLSCGSVCTGSYWLMTGLLCSLLYIDFGS